MNAGFRLKVWTIRLFGIFLAGVGFLLMVQLAALLIWQYAIALETRAWPRLPAQLLFMDQSELATKPVAPFLQFIPEFEWGWMRDPKNPSALYPLAQWLLDKVHIGALPALLGALLALKGVTVFIGQRYRLTTARQHDDDRLRRIREYRRQPAPGPSLDRESVGEQTDPELIEAAEKAWRQERMRVLR